MTLTGKILIDNQDIRKISLNSLRKNISLVSQDIILFDDKINNNVTYAKVLTQNEVLMPASSLLPMNLLKSYPKVIKL